MAQIRAPIYLSPRLPVDRLPPAEHDYARFIDTLLHDLGRRCADFHAAISLFDDCTKFLEYLPNHMHKSEEYSLRWHWRSFAVREAVTTIYRIFECLEYGNKNLGKCPVLQTLVDHKLKRAAMKAFKEHFPGVDGVRHGIQHYAKLYGTPEDFTAHATSEELNFVNHLEGRTVRTIFRKKHVSLEISEETLLKLREVRDLYWHAYMAAAAR
jgi:hypothetical protein